MSRTERLDALFDRWTATLSAAVRTHFFRDGIYDEDEFVRAPFRLVFVAAEPNAVKSDQWGVSQQNDLRVLTRETAARDHFGAFGSSIARWAGLLLEGHPVGSSIDRRRQILRVAMVNLKKVGGLERAVTKDVDSWADENRGFLLEEIEIINPHVLVTCGGHVRTILPRILTGDAPLAPLDTPMNWRGTIVLPSLHPSSRKSSQVKDSFLYEQALRGGVDRFRGRTCDNSR